MKEPQLDQVAQMRTVRLMEQLRGNGGTAGSAVAAVTATVATVLLAAVALTAALRVVLLLRRLSGGHLAQGHLARHQRDGRAFLGRHGLDADAELLLLRDQHVEDHAAKAHQEHRLQIHHSLDHTARPQH